MNNLAVSSNGGSGVIQSNYSTAAAPVTIYGTPVRRSTRSTTANLANSAVVTSNSNKRYY